MKQIIPPSKHKVHENQETFNAIENDYRKIVKPNSRFPISEFESKSKLKRYLEKIKTLDQTNIILEKEKLRLENAVERMQKEAIESNKAIEEMKTKMEGLEKKSSQADNLESQIGLLIEQCKFYQELSEKLRSELKEKSDLYKELKSTTDINLFEINAMRAENSHMKEEILKNTQLLEEKDAKISSLKNLVSTLNSNIEDMSAQFTEEFGTSQEENITLVTKLSLLKRKVTNLSEGKDGLKKQFKTVQVDYEDLRNKYEEVSKDKARLERIISEKDIKLTEAMGELIKLKTYSEDQQMKIQRSIHSLESKYMEQITEKESRIIKTEAVLTAYKDKVSTLEAEIENLKGQARLLNKNLKVENNSNGSLSLQIQTLNDELQHLRDKNIMYSDNISQLKAENQVIQTELHTKNKIIEKLREDAEIKEIEYDKIRNSRDEASVEVGCLNSKIKMYETEIQDLKDKLEQREEEMNLPFQQKMTAEMKKLNQTNEKLMSINTTLEAEVKNLQNEAENYKQKSKTYQEEIEKLENTIAMITDELDVSKKELKKTKEELNNNQNDSENNSKLAELLLRITELENMLSESKKKNINASFSQVNENYVHEIKRMESQIKKLEAQLTKKSPLMCSQGTELDGTTITLHTFKMQINQLQKENDKLKFDIKTACSNQTIAEGLIRDYQLQLEDEKKSRYEILHQLKALTKPSSP